MIKISYSGYRFPPEIIQHAIWLYIRFTLSFHDVEDLLAERGMSLPKSRFERTDDVARQGLDGATTSPNRLIGRAQDASFPTETCARISL
jgi:hypothetical protein